MRLLFDTTMAASHRALDALTVAQETIADNIANVDTPGFRALEVTFQDALAYALDRERDAQRTGSPYNRLAVDEVTPTIVPQTRGPARRDGNNVDIDREMTTLVETSMLYGTLAQLLASKFRMITSAIRWTE